MKEILFLLCTFLTLGTYGQDAVAVPDLVRLGLYTDFSSVASAKWTNVDEDVYRVDFTIYKNKHSYMAKYDRNGNWLEKSVEMEFARLPMSVIETIVQRFQSFKPTSSVRIEQCDQATVFHVNLEKWQPGDEFRQTYSVDISPEGELLNTTAGLLKASVE